MPVKVYNNKSNVKQSLETYLMKKRIKGDVFLPSERLLSAKLACNRKTLRDVLLEFDADGITQKLARTRIISPIITKGQIKKNIIIIAPTDESVHDPTLSSFYNAFSRNNDVVLRVINSNGEPSEVIEEFEGIVSEGVNTAFVVANSVKLAALEKFMDRVTFYRLKADDLMKDYDTPGVFIDYHYGAYIGMKHLIETGRRKIFIISNTPDHQTHVFADFERGCRDAVRDADSKVSFEFFHQSKDIRFNNVITKKFIEEKIKKFDAVFAYEDFLLVKLHNFLISNNTKIPEDISLLGFKNTPWSTSLYPQLSSISTRDALIVKKAIEMMEQKRNSIELVKPKLVIRKSTSLIK